MKNISRTTIFFVLLTAISTQLVNAEESTQIATERRDPFDIAEPFTDTVGNWAEPYIEDIRLRGIIDGKNVGIFGADFSITRAEITKIAMETFVGTFDRKYPLEDSFPDVDRYEWYGAYIDQAKERGIIKEYTDGTFEPNGLVTRAEALKILLEASGIDFADPNLLVDENNPKTWYQPYITYAEENGILNSAVLNRSESDAAISLYQPHRNATRAEIAKFTSLIVKAQEESFLDSEALITMLDEESSSQINLYYDFDTDNFWKNYTNSDYGFSFNIPAAATRSNDNDYYKTILTEQNGVINMDIADGEESKYDGIDIYFGKAKDEDELIELVRERFGEGCVLYKLENQIENNPVEKFGFGVSDDATDPSGCTMGKPQLMYNHETETTVFYSVSNGLSFIIKGQGGSYADLYPYDLSLEI